MSSLLVDQVSSPGRVAAAPGRLAGLDVARGLMLVVSVSVNAWFTAPAWFGHAVWVGVNPEDLVFPTFVTLSGAGLGILYARPVRWRREGRRVAVLLATGVVYNAWSQWLGTGRVTWDGFHLTGVLQLYACVVLGMLLLARIATSWPRWMCIAVVLAGIHTAVLGLWARECPGGELTKQCNPSAAWDLAMLGGHAYVRGTVGHDPEGTFGVLGALICAAVGAAAACIALDRRDGAGIGATARAMLVLAAVCLAGYLTASQVVPPFKRMWTAPFAFEVAGCVAVILLLLHVLLDLRPVGRAEQAARYPFVALGRNSLLVYFGSHAVMAGLVLLGPEGRVTASSPSWAARGAGRAAELLGVPGAMWPWCLAAVLGWTTLAVVLHRFRIYVKA